MKKFIAIILSLIMILSLSPFVYAENNCDIDSVIGDSSGFPITKEFLKKMNEYWF